MHNTNQKTDWHTYCKEELVALSPILEKRGYTLATKQPHVQGERFLMHALTTASGKKVILVGHDAHNQKVVIKATRDAAGIRELERERACRTILKKIRFAGEVFHTPEEKLFVREGGFVIAIQQFIEQEQTFLSRPLESQFTFALNAFKAQESAHATTSRHRKLIRNTFAIRNADTYLKNFATFRKNIETVQSEDTQLHITLERAYKTLCEAKVAIEQYTGFLTHTDFVPHNIRIQNDTIYLLDHSSLTFGNKYEGWARFLNFMTLYNPPLEQALVTYVTRNRTHEETETLRAMRIYRLGEIILYYCNTLNKSTNNLLTLNTARIQFWSTILAYMLDQKPIPPDIVTEYRTLRDSLRSEDEKMRQQDLH